MAFWSTQKVRAEQQRLGNLIEPFDPNKVKQGAYELTLSRDVLTSPPTQGPRLDGTGKALEIRPGDFALLYTNEAVTVPSNVIGFISIKAGLKLDGLVNISGFHVDPGFSTRLKFSVHNAGPLPIYLNYDEPAFLIWFSDLDAPTVEAETADFTRQGVSARRCLRPRRPSEFQRRVRLVASWPLFGRGAKKAREPS
jgi:dCTP deaminase